MPKQKTSKTAAKRFWKTAGGKIKYKHPGASHLLMCKSRKRKRSLKGMGTLSAVETKRLSILLG